MRPLFKYLVYAAGGLIVLLIGLVLFVLFGPAPNYVHTASFVLPRTNLKLTVELKPAHRFLAEYERKLVVTASDQRSVEQLMFGDSGGYTRTNLYSMSDGTFLIKSFFDGWLIRPNPLEIIEVQIPTDTKANYLGAFDWTREKIWRFIPVRERSEQTLTPGGG